jgi:hypothetical protein
VSSARPCGARRLGLSSIYARRQCAHSAIVPPVGAPQTHWTSPPTPLRMPSRSVSAHAATFLVLQSLSTPSVTAHLPSNSFLAFCQKVLRPPIPSVIHFASFSVPRSAHLIHHHRVTIGSALTQHLALSHIPPLAPLPSAISPRGVICCIVHYPTAAYQYKSQILTCMVDVGLA